jgi:hypothetical protein
MRKPFLLICLLSTFISPGKSNHSSSNLPNPINPTNPLHPATPLCECGYSLNATTSPTHAVFTDLLETDFLHLSSLHHLASAGWRPQAYNVTPGTARGPLGKVFEASNVVPNPLRGSAWDWAGPAVGEGDAGLQLWVRRGLAAVGQKGMDGVGVRSAELSADGRLDLLYGSFRVGMKMAGVKGTCGAFFWVSFERECVCEGFFFWLLIVLGSFLLAVSERLPGD